jgi:hypothetical protein
MIMVLTFLVLMALVTRKIVNKNLNALRPVLADGGCGCGSGCGCGTGGGGGNK